MKDKCLSISLDLIARKAGCSKTAVSLALRNRGRISGSVRRHIFSVANGLGYVPSGPGRKPRRSQGKVRRGPRVATLLLYGQSEQRIERSENFGARLAGLRAEFQSLDVPLRLAFADTPHAFRAHVDSAEGGLLLMGGFRKVPKEQVEAIEFYSRTQPVVLVGNYFEGRDQRLTSVRGDFEASGGLMAELCLRAERSSIAAVIGNFESQDQDRLRGLERVLAAAGGRLGALTFEGAAPLEGLWERVVSSMGGAPQAVVAGRNVSRAIWKSLLAWELRVPQDVALLCFAGKAWYETAEPVLASVRFDDERIGRVAARTWMEMHTQDGLAPRKVLLPPRFSPGESF